VLLQPVITVLEIYQRCLLAEVQLVDQREHWQRGIHLGTATKLYTCELAERKDSAPKSRG